MRYHWGLAVGHTYTHKARESIAQRLDMDIINAQTGTDGSVCEIESVIEPESQPNASVGLAEDAEHAEEVEDLELGLEDLEDDLRGEESDSGSDEMECEDADGELLEAMGIYGPDESAEGDEVNFDA